MYGLPVPTNASTAAAAKSRSTVAADASPGLAVCTMASNEGRISRSHSTLVMSPSRGVTPSFHTRAPADSLRTSAVTFSSLSTSFLWMALPACPVAPVRKTCISFSSLRKGMAGAETPRAGGLRTWKPGSVVASGADGVAPMELGLQLLDLGLDLLLGLLVPLLAKPLTG